VRALFYLDTLLSLLPLFLMLYLYASFLHTWGAVAHFNTVTAKVERLSALSTLIIYQHSVRDERGVALFGYVEDLPERVEVEFPVSISREAPEGANCIYRITWDGSSFVKYHFCG